MNNQIETPNAKPTNKQRWNTRGFVSLLLTLQTVIMTVSGIVRYISPRGREAHWVDWRVLGLDKDQWSSIHMVSALAFVILAMVHLLYNWRPMLSYIRRKSHTLRRRGLELIAAAGLSLVLVGLTIANVPPANILFVESEHLKDNFAASIQRAPWAHAEEATIETVCKRLGISVEQALKVLKEANLPARNSTETLAEIARRHGTSPMEVFAVIRRNAPKNFDHRKHMQENGRSDGTGR